MDNKKQLAAAADYSVARIESILSNVNYMLRTRDDYINFEWQFLRDLDVDLKKTIKELQCLSGALERYVENHIEK